MRKIITNLISFIIFFSLSSCYKTKINTEALLYDKDHQSSIQINLYNNASWGGSTHYFGIDHTQNSAIASTTPYQINFFSCITSYSLDIYTGVSNMTAAYLNINEIQQATNNITLSSNTTGHFENKIQIYVGNGERLRFELQGAAMTGTFDALLTVNFGLCK